MNLNYNQYMSYLQGLFGLWQSLGNYIAQSPFIVFNHVLQATFFSTAISNMVALVLKQINFAYAEDIASSKVIQFIGVILLLYLKIWDYNSNVVYAVCVFSLIMVSLYVYDCCGNISQAFEKWKTVRRELALIICFCGMFGSTFFVFWAINRNNQNPLHYQYTGIYIFILILVAIGHVIRNRSMLYALVAILTMNYLIASRYILQSKIWQSFWNNPHLPLTLLPFFMMALDAEKKQRKAIGTETYVSLFNFCISMSAFGILNLGPFPLELILGLVFLFGLVINK